MILYPAIDLKDGKCVRLLQGNMDKATVFSNSPVHQALEFQKVGCEWLHLVDLDGAFEGRPMNRAVGDILKACPKMKIQLGGGIRNMETIEACLSKGIARVILGTVAAENPKFVREVAKAFPDKIAVGIDSRSGSVSTHGWANRTSIFAPDLAKKYQDSGVAAIIYTDIFCDGLMQGPNFHGTAEMAKAVNIPVIASGGVSSIEDLKILKNLTEIDKSYTTPLNGAIVGRAIYDKKIDIAEALTTLKPTLKWFG